MKIYPTRIVICDESDGEVLVIVEDIDGSAAKVEIKTAVTADYWDELTVKVKEALVMMDLGG